MNELENAYFEEYKQTDSLCSKTFGFNGISEYIDTMYNEAERGKQRMPNWFDVVHRLKRLRRLRNQVAHESSSEITQRDYEELKRFHSDVSNGRDPLSKLYAHYNRRLKPAAAEADYGNDSGLPVWFVLVAGALILLLIFVVSKL